MWAEEGSSHSSGHDLVQHHGQDAPEGTELAAVSAGFDAQIELDVDGGGVGVGPAVARAQADPLLGFRFEILPQR